MTRPWYQPLLTLSCEIVVWTVVWMFGCVQQRGQGHHVLRSRTRREATCLHETQKPERWRAGKPRAPAGTPCEQRGVAESVFLADVVLAGAAPWLEIPGQPLLAAGTEHTRSSTCAWKRCLRGEVGPGFRQQLGSDFGSKFRALLLKFYR